MRIDILFPVLPPSIDGIGDHTARLASALSGHTQVRILTAQASPDPIEGVEIIQAFSLAQRRGVHRIVEVIANDPPDWLFIQFNQFSYGKWGLNPSLPLAIAAVKRRCRKTRIAWMAHEDFVPITNWRFAILTMWQRAQFVALGRLADLACFSIEPWARKYGAWFPNTDVCHLPVGSNFMPTSMTTGEAKRLLGLEESTLVVGIFGSVGHARSLPLIALAAAELAEQISPIRFLYVGTSGETVRSALHGLPFIDAGLLPAEEVSRHLAAMDIHLTPFSDGVSSRRGSFMAGLQQGVASATTIGESTDPILCDAAGDAFVAVPVGAAKRYVEEVIKLATLPEHRAVLGAAGLALYQRTFAFEHSVRRLMEAMRHREEGLPIDVEHSVLLS